jgi:hypothetical protein
VTTGTFDLMIEVVCKDDEELPDLLRIRRLPEVDANGRSER